MIKIAVTGAAGRMGRNIIDAINQVEGVELGAAIEHPQSSTIGVDAGELAGIGKNGITIVDDLAKVTDDFDVLIEFTLPDATIKNLNICRNAGKAIVIGTTGLSDEQKQQVADAGGEYQDDKTIEQRIGAENGLVCRNDADYTLQELPFGCRKQRYRGRKSPVPD